MKARAIVVACMLLGGCATAKTLAPTAPEPPDDKFVQVPLRNADFELPPRPENRCATGWNCSSHNNPDSHRFPVLAEPGAGGKQALCIEQVMSEPWAIATQGLFIDASWANNVMRVSMRIKAEGIEGGAGPWMLVQNGSGAQLAWGSKLAKSTKGWEPATYEFVVPPGAAVVEVGVTLEGPGRVCFDDVRLYRRLPS